MKKEKNKVFHFRVAGHPRGRQEPRKGEHSWYTPKETKKYYEHIRNSFQQLYPRLNDRTHAWHLRVDMYVYGKQYPDCSNVVKAVEDSLQGCIWHNDKQIWSVIGNRDVAPSKKNEGVYIYAEMLEEL